MRAYASFSLNNLSLERLLEHRLLLWTCLLLIRLPFYLSYDFLNVDEGAHLLGARTLLSSDAQLYEDFVDNKPPLIYLLYALPVLLSPHQGAMLATHLFFNFAVILPTTWALAACFSDRRRGTLAGTFFLLLNTAFIASDVLAANTEQAHLLPLSLAVFLALRPAFQTNGWLQVLTGVLLGLAVYGKQPALLTFTAFTFADPRSEAPLGEKKFLSSCARRAALLFLGGALVFGLTAVSFARFGTLKAACYWIFEYNFQHMSVPLSLADVGERALRLLLPLALAWLPALVLLRLHFSGRSPRRRFLTLLLLTTLLPAFLGARFFGHYFLPALFAITLLLFSSSELPRWAFPYAIVSAIGFTVANVFVAHPSNRLMDVTLEIQSKVGRAIAEDPCPGPLFVWGYSPTLYHFAERDPASRFVLPIDTVSGYVAGNQAYERGELDPKDRIVPEHQELLLADLKRNAPAFIVDTAEHPALRWRQHPLAMLPELEEFVHAHYELHADIEEVRLYRRLSCSTREQELYALQHASGALRVPQTTNTGTLSGSFYDEILPHPEPAVAPVSHTSHTNLLEGGAHLHRALSQKTSPRLFVEQSQETR